MNIFATDDCPFRAALNLDDDRVRKMIIESAQLLSFALIRNGDPQAEFAMKPSRSHMNHKCSLWAAESISNYSWLFNHYEALVAIDIECRQKMHASARFLSALMPKKTTRIPQAPRTEFANAARNLSHGIDMTHVRPVTMAYQLYLAARWEKRIASGKKVTWKGRAVPSFSPIRADEI